MNEPPKFEQKRGAVPEDLVRAIEVAPIGIAITDPRQPDNPVTYVNQEFCAITGYLHGELMGRNLRMLQGPASDPKAVADLRAAVGAGRPVAADLLNYRKDGTSFWMRIDIRPVFDELGKLRAYIASQTDITASREAQEKLKVSEERLRVFTNAIPLPMLTVRIEGAIVRANSAAHEAFGVTPGGLAGRDIKDFVVVDDPGHERLKEELHREGGAQRIEIRARRQDGEPLWLLASARMFTVRSETRFVLVFQDVTPLKRKEQELTEANEEAERNIRARMRFLAAASHDLRQPLQAMALFASALDRHIGTPQGRTIVQSLKVSLRGMEEMFDALLDMSKLDAGVMKAEAQVFLLNDIFEQLEVAFGPQAEAVGLRLRVVPTSLVVRSDPRLLARILSNFLSNAVRYTRKGGILLGARRHGNCARLVVMDTGSGIPEEQRLDIFREFRQLQGGRAGGTGLGLAIVQRLSRLMNHCLDVRSNVGRGSTFAIDVPMVEDVLPNRATDGHDEEIAPVITGATVVVIDDDPDIQEGLQMILENWGCQPVVAPSSSEALAVLTAAGLIPDAILADLHLVHEQSGIAAIRAVRQFTGSNAPAFLLTGDTEVSGTIGDDENMRVLHKPLDPTRLRSLLAGALGR